MLGKKIEVPGVRVFYELKDGRFAGMFHSEGIEGSGDGNEKTKPLNPDDLKAPEGFSLEIEHLTFHPATGIECWEKPKPWVILKIIDPDKTNI